MKKVFRRLCGFHWIKEGKRPSKGVFCDERGAAAITVMIIIVAMAMLVVSSTAFVRIDDLDMGYSTGVSGDALLSAESCAEEALIRLSRDSSYSGGSLEVGIATCTISVTGTPCGNCTITVEAIAQDYTRNVQVGITITGGAIDITSWSETN